MRFAFLALCVIGLAIGLEAQSELKAPVMSEIPADFAWGNAVPIGTPRLVAPVSIEQIKPTYTPPAMRARISGTVDVDILIDLQGKVARARIAKSLDDRFGLDENALFAARQWTFTPGQMGGQPTFVIARVTLLYQIG
jgi:TonB family protein